MRYSDYKKEVFAENPEVKEEYDRLAPQYEVIRAAIASRKAAGLTQKQLAEKMSTKQTSHALKTGMPTLRWSFCKKWRLVWARRCTSPLSDGMRPHRATGAVFSVPAFFQKLADLTIQHQTLILALRSVFFGPARVNNY